MLLVVLLVVLSLILLVFSRWASTLYRFINSPLPYVLLVAASLYFFFFKKDLFVWLVSKKFVLLMLYFSLLLHVIFLYVFLFSTLYSSFLLRNLDA
jgi:hypothetical protein